MCSYIGGTCNGLIGFDMVVTLNVFRNEFEQEILDNIKFQSRVPLRWCNIIIIYQTKPPHTDGPSKTICIADKEQMRVRYGTNVFSQSSPRSVLVDEETQISFWIGYE